MVLLFGIDKNKTIGFAKYDNIDIIPAWAASTQMLGHHLQPLPVSLPPSPKILNASASEPLRGREAEPAIPSKYTKIAPQRYLAKARYLALARYLA